MQTNKLKAANYFINQATKHGFTQSPCNLSLVQAS